ncbi:hypothetical protein [Spirosoma montaniterrae]|uniref:Uncharacterized protein n=1 Tax=Spirosoma montaniterrae TaxID=1178516 RepID=A0A1P9WV11_9BACT|nr:hypothetical protein [Spirosoma montaniterrae]AQG79193.1 hypothetical protein AWR27_07565 [Spirosoma montaniterrae]
MIRTLVQNPNRLFLIDSLGAVLTFIGLTVVLMPFEPWFGMPRRWLVLSAIVAAGLALYSGVCFLFVKGNWRPFLRVVSVANGLYCALTAYLVVAYYSQLTALGVAYFVGEIMVICGLVFVEQRVITYSCR